MQQKTPDCVRQSEQYILGMLEGAAAPSNKIRSGDMCGARTGCKPFPISFSGRAHSAQENDVNPIKHALAGLIGIKNARLRTSVGRV